MKGTTISNINNAKSLNGAALQCHNCLSLTIDSCRFDYLTSEIGGAVYLKETFRNKQLAATDKKYYIYNTYFTNNQAFVGGALMLDNTHKVYIEGCIFSENKVYNTSKTSIKEVSGAGGAIYFHCESDLKDCQLIIAGQTKFFNNVAYIKGGAIYWDEIKPLISEDTQYSGNDALFYGPDLAAYGY